MKISEKIGVLEAALAHQDFVEVQRPILPSYAHLRGMKLPPKKRLEETAVMDHPTEGTGVLHAILLGAGAAIIALLIAQFFPSIIPARATAVKL